MKSYKNKTTEWLRAHLGAIIAVKHDIEEELESRSKAEKERPAHKEGEPCEIPIYYRNREEAQGLRFEYTGEYRYPKEGDWVASAHGDVILIAKDLLTVYNIQKLWILRAIPIVPEWCKVGWWVAEHIFQRTVPWKIKDVLEEYGGVKLQYVNELIIPITNLRPPSLDDLAVQFPGGRLWAIKGDYYTHIESVENAEGERLLTVASSGGDFFRTIWGDNPVIPEDQWEWLKEREGK